MALFKKRSPEIPKEPKGPSVSFKDIVRVELYDIIMRLETGGPNYPVYFVDRCCQVAVSCGYSYEYFQDSANKGLGKSLILNDDDGKIIRFDFVINPETQFARVVTSGYKKMAHEFLNGFSIYSAIPEIPDGR